jgi:hypothetical protein
MIASDLREFELCASRDLECADAGGGQQDGIRSSVGLAIGGDYLATAVGIDHLVAEFTRR